MDRLTPLPISTLRAYLQNPSLDDQTFSTVITALRNVPPNALPSLLQGLSYDLIDPRVRQAIAEIMPAQQIDVPFRPRSSVNPFSPELAMGTLQGLAELALNRNRRQETPSAPPQPVQPVPEEEQAILPPLLPDPAPPTPRPPVTTPAAATPTPTTQATGQQPSSSSPSGKPTKKPGFSDNFLDRLAAFGFAMAASRNPSLFGMIGEAGLGMQRHEREQRELAARERQIADQSEYNRARIELARAELDWSRDPTNPANIARLAQARAMLQRAESAADRDPITARATDRQGNLVGITRSGRVVPLRDPEGNPLPAPNETSQDARALDSMRRQYIMQRVRELTAVPAGIPGARPQMDAQSALRQAMQEANEIFPTMPSAIDIVRGRAIGNLNPDVVVPPPVRPNIPVYDPVRGRLVDRQ